MSKEKTTTYMVEIGLRNTTIVDGEEVFVDGCGKPIETQRRLK